MSTRDEVKVDFASSHRSIKNTDVDESTMSEHMKQLTGRSSTDRRLLPRRGKRASYSFDELLA